MAYITKAQVQEKNKKLKELNKKYNVKGIFSGSSSSSLTLTVHEGSLDFVKWYVDYLKSRPISAAPWYGQEKYMNDTINEIVKSKNISINYQWMNIIPASPCLAYFQDALEIMLEGHYDNSDSMTDYFDTAWYISIQVGKWNKPYKLKK